MTQDLMSALSKTSTTSEVKSDLDVIDFALLVVSQRKLVVRFILAGLLAGLAVAFVLPVKYVAPVRILPPQQQGASTAAAFMSAIAGGGNAGSLAGLSAGSLLKNPGDL